MFFSDGSAGHGARRLISSKPVSIIAFEKISFEAGFMSARKPSGWAAGLLDLKRGLMTQTLTWMGLLYVGEDATQWIQLLPTLVGVISRLGTFET